MVCEILVENILSITKKPQNKFKKEEDEISN